MAAGAEVGGFSRFYKSRFLQVIAGLVLGMGGERRHCRGEERSQMTATPATAHAAPLSRRHAGRRSLPLLMPLADNILAQAWVLMDDTHTMTLPRCGSA
jgi:hypothetical protein